MPGMNRRRRGIAILALAAACGTQPPVAKATHSASSPFDSLATATAVDVATQRMQEHGQAGLSVNDVARTRDWFTPQLYALLVQDMSSRGEIGYLDSDPFTDAQDDVGPSFFEDMRVAGDTVMVRFSRAGYQQATDTITIAMRRVDGAWRIANFIYAGHAACHRDLAVGLARYARRIAGKPPLDDGRCSD